MRLIDADALITFWTECLTQEEIDTWDMRIATVIENVKDQPTVDAVPVVHGHWIGKPLGGYATVRCSVCKNVLIENEGKWQYCPHCGAKMDEVTE